MSVQLVSIFIRTIPSLVPWPRGGNGHTWPAAVHVLDFIHANIRNCKNVSLSIHTSSETCVALLCLESETRISIRSWILGTRGTQSPLEHESFLLCKSEFFLGVECNAIISIYDFVPWCLTCVSQAHLSTKLESSSLFIPDGSPLTVSRVWSFPADIVL